MIQVVFDACVLIDFLQAQEIGTLFEHFQGCAHIVEHVRTNELGSVVGITRANPCIHNGIDWLTTVDLDSDEFQIANELKLRLGERHRGEAESIAVCFKREYVFLTSDKEAIRHASHRSVQSFTTTGILNFLLKENRISCAEARRLARSMAERGVVERDIVCAHPSHEDLAG